MLGGAVLSLDGQTEAVISIGFGGCGLARKTLLYVTGHSVNVSRLGCDFLINI
jgi:hypothetical protein